MIDVKQAAQIAFEYFDDIYADAPISNVLLEEVERADEEEPHWLITVGFTDEASGSGPLASMVQHPRRYKVFKIHAETGEVKSMKIRSVANA